MPLAGCLPFINKIYNWLEGCTSVLDETVVPGFDACVAVLRREIGTVVRFEAHLWMAFVDRLTCSTEFILGGER